MSNMVETEKTAAKVPSDDDKPAPAPGEESGNAASPGPGKS